MARYFNTYNPDAKSSTLLNAIKGSATPLYQEVVPDATSDNLAEVGDSIINNPTTYNEFVKAILDRIGMVVIKNASFANPLKNLKKGFINKGKYIEEIMVDIIKAESYDPRESAANVEKRALPNISAVFHELNRADKFKTTVEEETISLAFTSEEGFGTMIDKIIDNLYVSNEIAEFELMKAIIRVAGKSGKLATITVPTPTDEASAKQVITAIKKVSNQVMFPSTVQNYNYARSKKAGADKNEQLVFIEADFDAIMDVEVLASAFNMEKAEFMGRKIVLDDFGGLENVVALLTSEDWWMVWDKVFKTKARENEDGLYWNYWLHVHQFMSSSPFEFAVAFVTATPTLTAIDLEPATANATAGGEPVHFTVEPTGTNNPSTQCTYAHNGASDYTYVNSIGMLYVGDDESVSPLTVTATSTFNVAISDSATVTLV